MSTNSSLQPVTSPFRSCSSRKFTVTRSSGSIHGRMAFNFSSLFIGDCLHSGALANGMTPVNRLLVLFLRSRSVESFVWCPEEKDYPIPTVSPTHVRIHGVEPPGGEA